MHGQGGELSTKIINNKNRKEFYLNQTEDYNLGNNLSVMLRSCAGEAWFHHSFISFQNKEPSNRNMQGYIPSRFQKG